MKHTLLLEIPENVYDVLTRTAEQVGRPREALAVEWLVAALNRLVNDPLEDFIGAFSSVPESCPRAPGQNKANSASGA
jgi:hypothetical protein